MARALGLAEAGRYSTHPNPRVGCVIVKDDTVVGEGAHLKAGQAHAEVHALRMAGEAARGADVFVTLEPCNHHGHTPPCVDALIAAGVRKVWAAMRDPNPLVAGQGLARLEAAGIATEVGLLAKQAEQLNRGFLSRMRRQRPYVTLKVAASLDGRTAMANGESRWITGPAARADVHRLRAEAGAVLTSATTVLADDCALTVRDFQAPGLRQPDRIVLDRTARVPPSAAVWAEGARRFWLTATAPTACPAGVVHRDLQTSAAGALSLPAVLAALHEQQINHVLVEAGAGLTGAFLAAGLADELVVYLAPRLLGHEARALALLPGLQRLADGPRFRFTEGRPVGEDLCLTAVLNQE
jgi:diaminohydroxyphosphoribosylaminopyrimidine deaminase/5-amino-6-(5-phosphoribosylamino)uracil reductase